MLQEPRLPSHYIRVLTWLSQRDGRNSDDLLKDAVDHYLAEQGLTAVSILTDIAPSLSEEENGAFLLELLQTLWAGQPKDLTSEEVEEIDRDIDETIREVRAEMAAERRAASA